MSKRTFTDGIRRAVDSCGLGRNELARRVGLDPGQMSRFMAGKGFLSEQSLNRLTAELRLSVTGGRESDDRCATARGTKA